MSKTPLQVERFTSPPYQKPETGSWSDTPAAHSDVNKMAEHETNLFEGHFRALSKPEVGRKREKRRYSSSDLHPPCPKS